MTLLARTTRSVRLTADGEAFFHRCKQILADLDDTKQVLARTRPKPEGTLRLSFPGSLGRSKIVPLLPGFQARHPKVDLVVNVTDRHVNLVDEGFDLAVRFGPLPDSSLIAVKLASTCRRIVSTPAYLKKCGLPKALEDLARHNCLALTYHETGRVRAWSLAQAGVPTAFTPAGSMSFNDGQALYAAVKAGVGLGQIHDYQVDADIQTGALVAVLEPLKPTPDDIYAVYPQAKHLSPKVRAFIDFVTPRFG